MNVPEGAELVRLGTVFRHEDEWEVWHQSLGSDSHEWWAARDIGLGPAPASIVLVARRVADLTS
jgi:hypothetical protein